MRRKSKVSWKMPDITGSIDNRDEKIGRKIRDSEVKKSPFHVDSRGKRTEEENFGKKAWSRRLGKLSQLSLFNIFKGIFQNH
jgi:threonyl-tRNA synthetase